MFRNWFFIALIFSCFGFIGCNEDSKPHGKRNLTVDEANEKNPKNPSGKIEPYPGSPSEVGAGNGENPDSESPNSTQDTNNLSTDGDISHQSNIDMSQKKSLKLNLSMKSSSQLRGAIKSCLGDGLTVVEEEMVSEINPENGEKLNEGIFPESFKINIGKDIITVLEEEFDGTKAEVLTGTRPDKPNFNYLSSLNLVANTVALNCQTKRENASSPSASTEDSLAAQKCTCNSEAKAREMLSRCIPDIDFSLSQYDELRTGFVDSCRVDPIGAIASMLGSLPFARVP